MSRITITDGCAQRRLIVEGQLINSWASELRIACEKARSELNDRELVIDLDHLTAINQAGENLLLDLMRAGVTFRARGVFTKNIMDQLARRIRKDPQGSTK
jgi:anti-anti-sigma regulatory factor